MSMCIACSDNAASFNNKECSLRINLRKEPCSLDPRKGNDMVASQLHFMLFEGLLRLNSDMSLSCAQAISYEISPDGKIYTFHLGNNKWSDGSSVTAYDFEKSWKSILDPHFPSPDAYLLYMIKNAQLAKEGKTSLEDVGVYSKDEKTLLVELAYPSPHFLQTVASSVLLPIPSRIEEKHPDWASSVPHFVSNGPFRLQEWQLNQEIVLEKNSYYRKAEEVGLKQVFIEIIDREMAVLHMYASGYFDLIGTPLSFFPVALQQDLEKKKCLNFFPVATTKFLAFNTTSFPFHNVNIRRALAFAIDRKAIVEHITQLHEKEALNVIPPVLLSVQENPLFSDSDKARAKECLRKGLEELNIPLKSLGPITFIYCSNEINYLIAQELQNRWQDVLGVRVDIEQVEFQTLHERSEKGEFSIGIFAWLADYGDPMNILERFENTGIHRNYSKWQSVAYNALLEKARHTTSQREYLEKIQSAEKLLIEEMPLTCLYHGNYAFLVQPYVKGLEISPLGHIYFDKIRIDSSKKISPLEAQHSKEEKE